jgi:aldehyde:ferredoxin oxidoreductase
MCKFLPHWSINHGGNRRQNGILRGIIMLPNDIIEIDLTTESITRKNYDNLFEKYIGGIGVGIHLFDQYLPKATDPLGPNNILMFIRGGISTFFPIVSKTVALFQSPLTGDLGESYAGGRLSMALLLAGIGGLVIRGFAEKKSYILIDDNNVVIKRAGPLGYMYNSTIARVLREAHPTDPGRRSIVRIGPAGENQVRYSSINVDSFRHFGRLGGGAVMGSKNLKALLVIGNDTLKLQDYVRDEKEYRSLFQKIWTDCVKTPVMRKYHVLGTPENILPLNDLNGLSTRNFAKSNFEYAEEISGDRFVRDFLSRRISCNTCPVGCIHIASLREQYQNSPSGDSPADIHTISVAYDYELLYALGANLEIKNPVDILKLIEFTEKQGVDSITAGLVLSWLAEAQQNALITLEDTQGISIQFGEVDGFIKALRKICYRESSPEHKDLFWYAGEGLHALTEKYGGHEFAMQVNNNPPAGYSTGPYTIMGHSIGARHSHLDNAGYSLDQKTLIKNLEPDKAIMWLVNEEEWRNVLNSLIICLFAKNVFTPSLVIDCLAQIKLSKVEQDLMEIGKEIQRKKLQIKRNLGFSFRRMMNDLPARFFTMPTSHGTISSDKISALSDEYIRIIGERYGIKEK